MANYPSSWAQFEEWFSSEELCRRYLRELRWPGRKRPVKDAQAGTVFERSRHSLRTWFTALWWFAGARERATPAGLRQVLGKGSPRGAWTLLRQIRNAAIPRGGMALSGTVEIGIARVGRGWPVAIAAAANGRRLDWVRLKFLEGTAAESLRAFGDEAVASRPRVVAADRSARLRSIARELDHWLNTVHGGRVRAAHFSMYLYEFEFHLNRRRIASEGRIFRELLINIVSRALEDSKPQT